MIEKTLTVNNEVGLHARPAALFVQTSNKFTSNIQVACGERKVNAKSILNVLTLGASKGSVIHIQAVGEDAEDAMAALEKLVQDNFGEAE